MVLEKIKHFEHENKNARKTVREPEEKESDDKQSLQRTP